ncbi:MAG: HTH domain-containing protein [bacterium]|nr:HTH domain-containing protein [bacterium]
MAIKARKIEKERIKGAELEAVIFDLLSFFPPKNQEIVKRRFGLSGKAGETLEAIGKDYGITRERVRQIEAVTLKSLKESAAIKKLDLFEEAISEVLSGLGGIAEETKLLRNVLGEDFSLPAYQHCALFVLHLSDKFFDFSENQNFNRAWTMKRGFFKRSQAVIYAAKKILAELGEPVSFDALYEKIDAASVPTDDLGPDAIQSYLSVSKEVTSNLYQDWGLFAWSEINPRGVKDKAFMVLKRAGQPLHFQKITGLINQNKFDNKQAHAPTVHNELIKDSRFVLVGRGIYGLKSWGYRPGTVKEIIADILARAKKPMPREKIVDLVLKQRMVRRSTVLLNLQDDSLFNRGNNGEVGLRA